MVLRCSEQWQESCRSLDVLSRLVRLFPFLLFVLTVWHGTRSCVVVVGLWKFGIELFQRPRASSASLSAGARGYGCTGTCQIDYVESVKVGFELTRERRPAILRQNL